MALSPAFAQQTITGSAAVQQQVQLHKKEQRFPPRLCDRRGRKYDERSGKRNQNSNRHNGIGYGFRAERWNNDRQQSDDNHLGNGHRSTRNFAQRRPYPRHASTVSHRGVRVIS